MLSLCGGGVGWGLQSNFVVKPNLVLRLGWGFDNMYVKSLKTDKKLFHTQTITLGIIETKSKQLYFLD